jgi:hypothetical protein
MGTAAFGSRPGVPDHLLYLEIDGERHPAQP